jgi:hypothetical protein
MLDEDNMSALNLAQKHKHIEVIKLLEICHAHEKEPVYVAPEHENDCCGLKHSYTQS